MKTLKTLSVLFILAIMGAVFAGCSSEEEDNGQSAVNDLVGSWRFTEDGYGMEYDFYANGTCIWRELHVGSYGNNWEVEETCPGTYVLDGKQLYVTIGLEDNVMERHSYTIMSFQKKNSMVVIDKYNDVMTFYYKK